LQDRSGSWQKTAEDKELTEEADVAIRYFPAVFYLETGTELPEAYGFDGPTLSGFAPDGSTLLVGYEIKPVNYSSPEAYQSAIRNFANWFTYYRKRHGSSRAGIVRSFSALSGLRVGVFKINSLNDVQMRDLSDAAQKKVFVDEVYAIRGEGGGTPNKQALDHAGKQFMRAGTGAPITDRCQQNFAILFTDGYSNQWDGADVGNADGNSGSPYADTVSNTMADIAMHYYKTTLRTDLPPGQVPVHNQCHAPHPDPRLDCNRNLHMVTFAVTLGTRGHIFGVDLEKTNDPYTHPPEWPLTVPTRNPAAVDDLWHATINGRGELLNANTPSEISEKLTSILLTIASRTNSMAAVTTNTTRLNDGTAVYQALFSSMDWSGQFKAFKYSKETQEELWDGAERIEEQAQRNIFTSIPTASPGSRGRRFLWNDLSETQRAALNVDPDTGESDEKGGLRLEYLRGNRHKEQPQGPFRSRGTLLGDIVNSDPHYVWQADYGFRYLQPEGAEYVSFRKSAEFLQRPPMVYVGANDGMLHGFNADTGNEEFAYVPNVLFPKLPRLSSPGYGHAYYVDGPAKSLDAYYNNGWHTVLVSGLGAGGRAVFALDVTDPAAFDPLQHVLWEVDDTHEDYRNLGHVMGQPTIVRLNDGTWAALFGNGYHNAENKAVLYLVEIATGELILAIDTEADGSDEQPNGLSAPRPLDANSDRITDAVYAGDLQGNLWKFDLSSAEREDWKVAFTRDEQPAPLFTARDGNGQAQPITTRPTFFRHPKGGIMVLFGTGQFFENEDVGTLDIQTFYGLRDDETMVLGERSDILQQQEIIWEGHWTYEDGEGTIEENESMGVRALSSTPVDWTVQRGWFLDLVPPEGAALGERLISDPVLVRTRKDDMAVLFNTMIPSEDPCGHGGSGWLMYFNGLTGTGLDYLFLDVNGDGLIDEKDFTRSSCGEVLPVSGIDPKGGKGFGESLTIITDGDVSHLVYPTNDGSMVDIPALTAGDTTGRQSWRQIR
jgi:type IV pilus assembly protein PilY1